ncbi:MAG: redox-regulated ATPase YchF [Verrucomicrobia bacterium]|nr:redox-regulated ATPase YchF [Verrucomicrobiota bacterium]
MKIALIGLPQTGKKTVFSLLTGMGLSHLLVRPGEYHIGAVKVADSRVDRLSAMYNPKKTKYAEIECTLAPAPPQQAKARDQWLQTLKNMDALCHVVRAFDRETDPHEDINKMNLELAISDLSLIEKRLDRIAEDQKKKRDDDRAKEAALLELLKPHLEAGQLLRDYAWAEGEEKRVRSLQFLTLKPLVIAYNGPVGHVTSRGAASGDAAYSCELDAKLELEVAQIEDPKERTEFLAALGVEEPAIHLLTRLLYKALGYISFFTTGEDEVRAWTIRHGATAVEAAHAIHSDLARGFIRAEVMKYPDLIAAGAKGHQAEVVLKETGKLLVKGKEYIVEDGDIVHIRHSS